MQEDTPLTDSHSLLVPAFTYGDRTTCQRKMKAEAKKWAKRYLEQGDFPEVKLIPIAPGSLVFTDEDAANFIGHGYSYSEDRNTVFIDLGAKQQGLNVQWRWYMINKLQSEASSMLKQDRDEYDAFLRAFETHVGRYPWGALVVAIKHAMYNSIEAVSRRVEAVFRFWELLDTVKYINVFKRRLSLGEIMAFHFQDHVAMWVDQPTGNIRIDLRTAIDQMRKASEDEIRARLIKRLRELVDIERDLKHRDWLKSPGVIEAELIATENRKREWYEDLTSGHNGGFLYNLAKMYPGTVH
jgi:hypothetical protein